MTASASRLGGGVATAVQAQAAMIRRAGGQATVITLADAFTETDRTAYEATPVRAAKAIGPGFFGFAPGMAELLEQADPDLVHLHGIWMYPSRAAARYVRRRHKPYLISPHGMLDPWITARGRWKKMLARAGYEREGWRAAGAFHALTEAEAGDIRREAGAKEVIVIPNAGPAAALEQSIERKPQVVYLGRIHLKKNLPALIEAWRQAQVPDGAALSIAGWGEWGEVAALKRLIQPDPSIRFVGALHGEDKRRFLAQARFTVLPSLSEGLPMTVLEAWASGTPTVMTAACHLPEGFARGAAIECGVDARSIAAALTAALRQDERQWAAMSAAALDLARGTFASEVVARRWTQAYRALAGTRA